MRADHWLMADGFNVPPMPMRMGTDDPGRDIKADQIRAAAKYAIRASTMNGKEIDFDPDAMVQNFVVALLGYWTPTGLSPDAWANPEGTVTTRLYRGSPFPYASDEAKARGCTCRPLGPTNRQCPVHDVAAPGDREEQP